MLSLLRIGYIFFKTWFLPQPAHDQFESVSPTDESVNTGDPFVPSELPPEEIKEIDASEIATAQMPRPAQIDASDITIEEVDFSHLVKSPEGIEGRANREKIATETPEIEIE